MGIIKPTNNVITIDEIKKLAEEELPNYMIPSKIILVKNIPLNSNGKLDRKKIIKNY